ncbi:enoyl-CoA hydratase/isomerase family protein [Thermodesulfobacteriota bacterium]
MDYKTIFIEKKGEIGFLYFNRPEVLNALSDEMRHELIHFLNQAAGDKGLLVLIITGKGRAFSAGADLNMFKIVYEAYRKEGESEAFGRTELPRAFIEFPKPIIAAINGPAVGFGLTVTLACDICLASKQAKFSCAFARVGVTPEFGSSYFLPRLIGYNKVAELAFTARMFDAEEAFQMGLINRVVEHENLLSEAENIANDITKMPSGAIQMAKQLLRYGNNSTLEQALEYESLVFQKAIRTKEHYEAVCRIIEQIKNRKKS